MAIKEYIKKSLETKSGYDAECNIVTGIWIDLKAGCAVIMLDQYKDFDSMESGKIAMGKRDVSVSGIEALPVFSSVHNAVVDTILADSEFSGGTLEQVVVPDIVDEV